jgi:DNA polymerase-4
MILHVDMDAFYASVEERENPSLKGTPLVVGGAVASRGVVAAANYEARKYGVFSAMPMASAIKKCPKLTIIKPNHGLYSEVSSQIHQIFFRYTPIIEPLSLDEAFLDTSGSEKLFGSTEEIGKRIKLEILQELCLVASVGVAPNKFLAKLASDHEKPDGYTVIGSEDVQSFLDPMPVERIWGVGKVATAKFHQRGIYTVFDLRQISKETLVEWMGSHGDHLWELAHGKDSRKVTPDSDVKSISQETTFETDIADLKLLESYASSLTEAVGFRLRTANLKGRTIQLKLRFSDFQTITRSKSLGSGTDQTSLIWETATALLSQAYRQRPLPCRLIGIGVSNFSDSQVQRDIFTTDTIEDSNSDLDKLSDSIKNRFGKTIFKRGKSLSTK